ncbi:hypothetical protein AVEN_66814-1 [Araneus ventricosus]|uniref:Uncharacterized protein n=1 Tax=Araneus ventricosus TaxID=182803 RepID=A0A4Y2DRS0_ARAVE|nr:hypothetical protein AVEN_66814-1 [Araneus ventricosus]
MIVIRTRMQYLFELQVSRLTNLLDKRSRWEDSYLSESMYNSITDVTSNVSAGLVKIMRRVSFVCEPLSKTLHDSLLHHSRYICSNYGSHRCTAICVRSCLTEAQVYCIRGKLSSDTILTFRWRAKRSCRARCICFPRAAIRKDTSGITAFVAANPITPLIQGHLARPKTRSDISQRHQNPQSK